MTAELNRVGDSNPSSRCYCRILCCREIIIIHLSLAGGAISKTPAGTEPECPKKVPRNHVKREASHFHFLYTYSNHLAELSIVP